MEAERESEAAAAAESHVVEASSTENPTPDETEEVVSEEQETVVKDEDQINSASCEISSPTQLSCLTVQPNRVLCGVRLKYLPNGDILLM